MATDEDNAQPASSPMDRRRRRRGSEDTVSAIGVGSETSGEESIVARDLEKASVAVLVERDRAVPAPGCPPGQRLETQPAVSAGDDAGHPGAWRTQLEAAVVRDGQRGGDVVARRDQPASPHAGHPLHVVDRHACPECRRSAATVQHQPEEDREKPHGHRFSIECSDVEPSTGRVATGRHPKTRAAMAKARSVRPKAQTTVAPVGRSNVADAAIPSTLTSVPKLQPISSRAATVPPSAVPASAGTMRYENTRSTPPIRTELVTTTPNEA